MGRRTQVMDKRSTDESSECDREEVYYSSQLDTFKVTAGELCQALWEKPSAELSRGFYPGTEIPLRVVPADAVVTVSLRSNGGVVSDSDGGWIADRFGPDLGARQARLLQRIL